MQVSVPQITVDSPKSPTSKKAGETVFLYTNDFIIGIAATAQISKPYPPSPKIIPKNMSMNNRNQAEMSYSKYPGTVPKKSVSG